MYCRSSGRDAVPSVRARQAEVFSTILKDIDRSGGLAPFRHLGGRLLIALDGSEHFCSRNIFCPQCSTRKHSDGGAEYFHSFVGATLVAPGHRTVFAAAARVRSPPGRRVEAGLRADGGPALVGPGGCGLCLAQAGLPGRRPLCPAADVREAKAAGGSFLLVCKPSSHKTLGEYLIPASPDTDTSPVSGRDGGPASSWTRSQGRGCARPASEGSLDESPSRPDGMRSVCRPLTPPGFGAIAQLGERYNGIVEVMSSILIGSTNKINWLAGNC